MSIVHTDGLTVPGIQYSLLSPAGVSPPGLSYHSKAGALLRWGACSGVQWGDDCLDAGPRRVPPAAAISPSHLACSHGTLLCAWTAIIQMVRLTSLGVQCSLSSPAAVSPAGAW